MGQCCMLLHFFSYFDRFVFYGSSLCYGTAMNVIAFLFFISWQFYCKLYQCFYGSLQLMNFSYRFWQGCIFCHWLYKMNVFYVVFYVIGCIKYESFLCSSSFLGYWAGLQYCTRLDVPPPSSSLFFSSPALALGHVQLLLHLQGIKVFFFIGCVKMSLKERESLTQLQCTAF